MGKRTVITLLIIIIIILLFLIFNNRIINLNGTKNNTLNNENVDIYESTTNNSIGKIDSSLNDLENNINKIDDINDADLVIPVE
jgi:hypothetical protein